MWGLLFSVVFCYSARLSEWSSVADELPEPPLRLPHGDRAFCLSPPKMALAFGVLGLVFVCAVAVALYTLLKGRHHYHSKVHLGEETLIVQDSPFMGHRIQWPHIRVMHWQILFCLCTVSSHEITLSQNKNDFIYLFVFVLLTWLLRCSPYCFQWFGNQNDCHVYIYYQFWNNFWFLLFLF